MNNKGKQKDENTIGREAIIHFIAWWKELQIFWETRNGFDREIVPMSLVKEPCKNDLSSKKSYESCWWWAL